MKKQFLLFLLTLLPLAGWAQSNIQTYSFTVDKKNFYYDTTLPTIVLTVTDPDTNQPITGSEFQPVFYDAADATEVIESAPDAGNYYVAAKAKDGDPFYTGETDKRVQITIAPLPFTGENITIGNFVDKVYTGLALTFANEDFNGKVTSPTLNGTTLVKDTDYEVSYSNNTNAGTATITFTGKGNYSTATLTQTFNINPKSIAGVTIGSIANQSYYIAPLTPDLTVTDQVTDTGTGSITTLTLRKDVDYTAVYTNNVEPGTATVEIKGKGNYLESTSKYATFKINKRSISGTAVTKTVDQTAKEYTGSEIKTTYTLKIGEEKLVEGTHYKAIYTDNTDAGTAKVKFEGDGKYFYNSTDNYEFTINPKAVTITAEPVQVAFGTDYTEKLGVTYSSNVTDDDKTAIGTITYKFNENGDEATATETKPDAVGSYYIYPQVAENANYTVSTKKGTLTITKANIYLAVKEKTITFGDAAPTYTAAADLEYVSGLPTGETYDVTNLTGTPTFTVSADATSDYQYDFLNANTNGYTVNVTNVAELAYGTDYVVNIASGNLKVNKKNISTSGVTIDNITSITYDGKQHNPQELTVKFGTQELAKTTDYTINDLADATANKNAGMATVTITGAGNFEGTLSKNFNIEKATLTITADDFTGEKAVAYNELSNAAFTATVEGLYEDVDLTETVIDGASGKLQVKFFGTSTVGMHTGELKAYGLGDETTNYKVNYVPGNLEITPATAYVKVTPTSKYYGEATPAFDFEYVSGMAENDDPVAWLAQVKVDNPYPEYVIIDEDEVVNTYKVKVNGLTSSNYTIKNVADAELGTLEIKARPIKITAIDQAIDLGADESFSSETIILTTSPDNSAEATVKVEANESTLTGSPIVTGDELYITISCDTPTKVADDNVITVTASNNNYAITLVNGTLKVTGAATIELTHTDAVYQLIKDYNGEIKNVKIADARTYAPEAEKWNAYVLPFETSVAELSSKVGYAVVNILDKTNSTKDHVRFQLWMGKINPNQPFLMKAIYDGDLNMAVNETQVLFQNKEIVDPETEYPIDEIEGIVKFTGVYKAKTLEKSNTDNTERFIINDNWWYALNNDYPIAALDAYLDMNVDAARALISVQDENGTTSIMTVRSGKIESNTGWYSINGVKLENAPTVKGIYIHDGKKVVIK